MIKRAHCEFIVLEYRKELIGYGLVLYHAQRNWARLYSLCTLDEYRGRGLAGALLSKLEKKAYQKGLRLFRLEVKPNNRAARRLYLHMGYEKFGEEKNFYSDGGTAHRYQKRLC
jgi:ribosomal protein S18 acetylase RimI-like enzyme